VSVTARSTRPPATRLAVTDPRLGAGVEPVIAGRPAVLVVVRGGSYAAGTPGEGWDHATLVGVNPALDQFTDMAAELRARAEETARLHGRALGAPRAA
jgi:FMN-dependent NADH-azoreductase